MDSILALANRYGIQVVEDNAHGLFARYPGKFLGTYGSNFGGYEGQCPFTERVSEQLLRLPMFSGLDEADQYRVIDAIYDFQMPGAKLTSVAASSAR